MGIERSPLESAVSFALKSQPSRVYTDQKPETEAQMHFRSWQTLTCHLNTNVIMAFSQDCDPPQEHQEGHTIARD